MVLNTNETNITGAINEVNAHADININNIGTLANLETDVKTDLVSAINETYDMSIALAIALG